MKNILFVCNENDYKYFSDYSEAFIKQMKQMKQNYDIDILLFKDFSTINISDETIYLFFQMIPSKFLHYKNVYVINTEQLSHPNNLDRIQQYINCQHTVIDYDLFQSQMTQYKQHMYVPYQINKNENDYLTMLQKYSQKIYDVVICPINTPRRLEIANQLREKGVNVVSIGEWKHTRDIQIAKAKILLNIHALDTYRIFEHLRCDRWVMSGLLVVSEDSPSDSLLDIKDLIIFDRYDHLVETVIKILNQYDLYYNQLMNLLEESKLKIIHNRYAIGRKFVKNLINC